MLAYIYKQSPPGYKIEIDGEISGHQLRSRILSISVVLNDGSQSDQLSLSIDDSQTLTFGRVKLPATGKKVKLWLGYDLHKVEMGTFHVDQVNVNGSSGSGTITITAVPKLLLDERSGTWANTKIGDIIGKIAEDNKLRPQVSTKFKSIEIDTENQTNETDLSFISKLAKKYDAVAKPASENLLFLVKGEAMTASGISLLPVVLKADDVIQWSCQLSDRTEYGSVVATWHNRITAQQEQVVAGKQGAKPIFRIAHLFSNKDEAKAAAEAKLNDKTREASTLNLTVVGDPGIVAGGAIQLVKLRDKVNGRWIVKSVTHTLDGSGYQCNINAYNEG